MDPCSNDLSASTLINLKDDVFKCFEENQRLKIFYQLLRSAQPHKKKCKQEPPIQDTRCFCEKKRAFEAERIKKENELRCRKELLLLQCMCASMGPVKEKLKNCKNKEEASNLRDKILKQCLCSAIGMILKTTDQMTEEKKKNVQQSKQLKSCIKARQLALHPENQEYKKILRECTDMAREECRKRYLRAKNLENPVEENKNDRGKNGNGKRENVSKQVRRDPSCTSIRSKSSKESQRSSRRDRPKENPRGCCSRKSSSKSRSPDSKSSPTQPKRKFSLCGSKPKNSSSLECCYSECKQKCDIKFSRPPRKRFNSTSSNYDSETSSKKRRYGTPNKNRKKKPRRRSSASTDSTKSTRFRGRWCFRGKTGKSATDSSYVPPKSSLKSSEYRKNYDDKKQLRFHAIQKCKDEQRSRAPSSERSSNRSDGSDSKKKNDKKNKSDDCLAGPNFWTAKSPIRRRNINSYCDLRTDLKNERQKGGETDTDQKSKNNPSCFSSCCSKSKNKSTESYETCRAESEEGICLDENPDPVSKLNEDNKTQEGQLPEKKNSESFSNRKNLETPELNEKKNEEPVIPTKTESSHTLMSDLSLTKVFNELVTVIKPELLADDNCENQDKSKPKQLKSKRRKSINEENRQQRRKSSTNSVAYRKSLEEISQRPIQMIMNFAKPFPIPRSNPRPSPTRLRRATGAPKKKKTNILRRAKKKINFLKNKNNNYKYNSKSSSKCNKNYNNNFNNENLMAKLSKKNYNNNFNNQNLMAKLSKKMIYNSNNRYNSKNNNNIENFPNNSYGTSCLYSCGNRKTRVNYIAPERWAAMKRKLKVSKPSVPLPEDFVLDTNPARFDREVERCRDLKRQRQLEEWCQEQKNRERQKKDAFYTPAMNRRLPGEKQESQLCYVCKPISNCLNNGGVLTYECCYCGCEESCQCAQNEQNNSMFMVNNNKGNISISKHKQKIKEICSGQRNVDLMRPESQTSSSHPSSYRSVKEPSFTDSNNANFKTRPQSDKSKIPKPKNKTPNRQSRSKTPNNAKPKAKPKPKSPSKSPVSAEKTPNKPNKRESRKSSKSSVSRDSTPANVRFRSRSKTPPPPPPKSRTSSASCDCSSCQCVGKCNCQACNETSKKINIDRERIKTFNSASQARSTYENELMKAKGCTCNLCNCHCCPFRVIEEHYYVSERNNYQSDYTDNDNDTDCSQPVTYSSACSGTPASSSTSETSIEQCSNLTQRHSWCCPEDSSYYNNDNNNPEHTSFSPRLDLLRDCCFNCPRPSYSADIIQTRCKKQKLYLWIPDTDCGENEEEEHVCNEDGNFIEVVHVRSNELGFLTNKHRQTGGCGLCQQMRKQQIERKRKFSLKSLKKMKKEFYCFKVRCEQKAINNKNNNNQEQQQQQQQGLKGPINNCDQLIVKACQLRCKKTNILGPIKFQVSESSQECEKPYQSKKYKGCHPYGCW